MLFVLLLFLVVWLVDIGVYFVGKVFGKCKLVIMISFGKSWEGVIGGWFVVMVVVGVVMVVYVFELILFFVFVMCYGMFGVWVVLMLLVVYSVIGDLFELLLKW